MREIKFRCFDKQTKQMSPPFTLFGEFLLIGAVHAWQHECGNDVKNSLEALKDLEVMQFTGLKDKHGKEIYEGDVCLKYWSKGVYGERLPVKGIVKWVSFGGRYTFEYNDSRCRRYYEELHENLNNPEYPRSLFEVIGNIYENPELCQ